MDNVTLKAKWNQFKGAIQEEWGELTNNDMAEIDGRLDQLIGTIQERYGKARKEVAAEVNEFLNNLEEELSEESETSQYA